MKRTMVRWRIHNRKGRGRSIPKTNWNAALNANRRKAQDLRMDPEQGSRRGHLSEASFRSILEATLAQNQENGVVLRSFLTSIGGRNDCARNRSTRNPLYHRTTGRLPHLPRPRSVNGGDKTYHWGGGMVDHL